MFESTEKYCERTRDYRLYYKRQEPCLTLCLVSHDVSGLNSRLKIVYCHYIYRYLYLYSFYRLFKIIETETQRAKSWSRREGKLCDRRNMYIILEGNPFRYRERYERNTEGDKT
jgi:hypothetical protein